MTTNFLLQAGALVAYLLLLVTWPVRKKKLVAQLGERVLNLRPRQNRFIVPVLVLAPALIVFQWFRDFGLMINLVLCGVALLAAELVIRERVLGAMTGVFKGGLVVDGRLILLDEIYALPTLSYEDEMEGKDEFYRSVLEIVTENSGTIRVGFASPQERDEAVAALVQLKPQLK